MTFWAIVVCVVGLVNSFLPWIIERRFGDSNWLTISDVMVKNRENQIQRDPYAAFGGVEETKLAALLTCLSLLLPAVALFVTAESRRLRWLRTAVMLISGVVWLGATLIFWVMGVPSFSELAVSEATAAPSVYVSLGLSAMLLALGTLEARRWLGNP